MLNTEDFIKRLEFIMDHYGLSASSFADKVSVQRSSISHLLSGRNKPSLDFIMKIIDVFPELNLYWLLTGTDDFLKDEAKENTGMDAQIAPPTNVESDSKNYSTLFSVENLSTTKKNQLSPLPTLPLEKDLEKDLEKSIEKIIVFYTDGTFDFYNPARPK